MSSKGKEYEIAAYQYFDNLIKQRFFGYPPEQCSLKHQPPYFSKDREKNIYFDLSLEYFLPDQSTPFLIHIIECKNYNKKVCIDDVEEFASKLEQLRTFKVFPIFLTTVGFQEGCLTFAKNRGIALWLYKPNGEHQILLNRQKQRLQKLNHHIVKALTDEKFDSAHIGNIFIQTTSKLTLYPKEYALECINSDRNLKELFFDKNGSINVPYLSKKQIANRSSELYETYTEKLKPVNLLDIIQKLNIKLNITEEIKDEDLLAQINFSKREITLFGKNFFSKEQH